MKDTGVPMMQPFASPLAFDLALSRVSLAALKAKAELPIDSEEKAVAEQLRQYFLNNLDALTGTQPITITVANPDLKKSAEEKLAALSLYQGATKIKDPAKLHRLLALLEAFSTQNPDAAAGGDLLDALRFVDTAVPGPTFIEESFRIMEGRRVAG